MLLVSRNDVFEIPIKYVEEKETLAFYEDDGDPIPTEAKTEKFFFRRPNWLDTKTISSISCHVDPFTGKAIVDPFKYMDQKFKTLLKDWTLKNDEGEKLAVTYLNIDLLRPEIVQYVFQKLEDRLNGSGAEVVEIPKVELKVELKTDTPSLQELAKDAAVISEG